MITPQCQEQLRSPTPPTPKYLTRQHRPELCALAAWVLAFEIPAPARNRARDACGRLARMRKNGTLDCSQGCLH